MSKITANLRDYSVFFNILLWYESEGENNKQTNLFPKFQLIPILPLLYYAWSYYRYCVELLLIDITVCENCSHFALKWFNGIGLPCSAYTGDIYFA